MAQLGMVLSFCYYINPLLTIVFYKTLMAMNLLFKQLICTPLRILLTAIALLSLSACSKSDIEKVINRSTNKDETTSNGAKTATNSVAKKFNAYVVAYNELSGTWGLQHVYDRYIGGDYTKIKKDEAIRSFSEGHLHFTVEKLKATTAIAGGGIDEVDMAAKELLVVLEVLQKQIRSIAVYLETKAYLDDNLSKIKSENADILKNFERAFAAKKRFGLAIEVVEQKESLLALEEMKKKGNMLAFQGNSALMQANTLVALYSSEESLSNADTYVKGNVIAAELTVTLLKLGEEYDKAKSKNAIVDYNYELIRTYLTSFVGHYRSLERSKRADDFNRMVRSLNDAIKNSNDIK